MFELCIKYLKILFSFLKTIFLINVTFNNVMNSENNHIINEIVEHDIVDDDIIDDYIIIDDDDIIHDDVIIKNVINNIIDNVINNIFNSSLEDNLTDDIIISTLKLKLNKQKKEKYKIGLLTNELPPIVYGGVATWIVNFIKMFDNSEVFEIVPIFLESYLNDTLPDDINQKYKNIRIIKFGDNIDKHFEDIEICVNNLWICTDILRHIKYEYPTLTLITVCHSLIIMENLTNLGSIYTNNFDQQEDTFKVSDIVVLISKAEEMYYRKYNYDKINPNTYVIYNSYTPKYDNINLDIDYCSSIFGYIGRHVPRKRPQLLIEGVSELKLDNILVHNFGVDTDRYHNNYWYNLKHKFKEALRITNFTSDKSKIEDYWRTIGCNCILGIYEPFGYTICEALDRRMPLIVSNIDGPKEIIESVKENVTLYEVDYEYKKDKDNFKNALLEFLKLTPDEKKNRTFKARKCLDRFRPERIITDWNMLFFKILTKK